MEFIREDFLGKKKKKAYTKQANTGRKARTEAVEKLKKLNIPITEKNILRYRLLVEQNKKCLYKEVALNCTKLENYEIDHIFPKEDGGPDAYYNTVLTSCGNTNRNKGKRLPCECDFIDWEDFKNRVKKLSLGKNKKKLLLASTREEAEDLIEKYTGSVRNRVYCPSRQGHRVLAVWLATRGGRRAAAVLCCQRRTHQQGRQKSMNFIKRLATASKKYLEGS